jgi:hypothetical protein
MFPETAVSIFAVTMTERVAMVQADEVASGRTQRSAGVRCSGSSQS